MQILHKKIKISGKVQGVFFRASAQTMALSIGIKGWVKNERNGDVSMECEAPEVEMNLFLEWCRKGPPHARVDTVETESGPVEGYTNFEIRR